MLVRPEADAGRAAARGLRGERGDIGGGGVGYAAPRVKPGHREQPLWRRSQRRVVIVCPADGLGDRPAEGVPVDLGRGALAVPIERGVREGAVVARDGEAAVVQRVVGSNVLADAAAELLR